MSKNLTISRSCILKSSFFQDGVDDKMEVDEAEEDAVSAVDNAYAVDLFLTAIHAIVEKEDLSAVAKGDSR